MIIKVITDIILNVEDEEEAEDACNALSALGHIMRTNSFPHEIIDTDVDHYEKASKAEIAEHGWDEE